MSASLQVLASSQTYTFPSFSSTTIDCNGNVVDRPVDPELGFLRSTVAWVSHPKTLFKFIATTASVGQIWSDSAELAAASNGFGAAGGLCGSLPDAIGEGAKAVEDIVKGKISAKTGASAFKSIGDFAGLVGGLEKMKIIVVSTNSMYIVGVVKNLFTVIGDLFSLFFDSFRKSKTDGMRVEVLSKELVDTSQNELWAARIKSVVALAFHLFLAVGAIFVIPLSPVAVTSVAVIYTVTAVAHHYIKSHRDDMEKRSFMRNGYGSQAVLNTIIS